MPKITTIYTIGGSGFIGRNLIAKLLKENYRVINIDPVSFKCKSSNYKQYTFSLVDCLHFLDQIIIPNSIVFYLASASVPGKEKDPINDYKKSVKPFIEFINKLILHNPKIVFVSSAGAIYGENQKHAREKVFLNPKSLYGVHKLLIEKYLFYFYIKHNIDYRIARISNPYGNNQKHQFGIGFIDVALQNIRKKKEIKIYGELSNMRDFIHINDVVDALTCISNFSLLPPNRVINISYGKSISLKKVINLIEKESGNKFKVIKGPINKEHVKKSLVNNSILKKIYGFSPQYKVEDYIKDNL